MHNHHVILYHTYLGFSLSSQSSTKTHRCTPTGPFRRLPNSVSSLEATLLRSFPAHHLSSGLPLSSSQPNLTLKLSLQPLPQETKSKPVPTPRNTAFPPFTHPTRLSSTILLLMRFTYPCQTGYTSSGRSNPCKPASTCCWRNRRRLMLLRPKVFFEVTCSLRGWGMAKTTGYQSYWRLSILFSTRLSGSFWG